MNLRNYLLIAAITALPAFTQASHMAADAPASLAGIIKAQEQGAKDVTLNVDPIKCADDWSEGWLLIDKAEFAEATEGDEISIVVSEISSTCANPVIYFQTGDWKDLNPQCKMDLTGKKAPLTHTLRLTKGIIDQINATGGLVIKGCGYTMTTVKLHLNNASTEDRKEGHNVLWKGSTEMPMSWGAWVSINAPKFAEVTAGNILRLYIDNVKPGAQGRINDGVWAAIPGADTFPALSGTYYQYEITQAMLDAVKKKGMIISGCGYTLVRVEEIDPATLPNVSTKIIVNDDDYVWESGETPSITLSVTNKNAKALKTECSVRLTTDDAQNVAEYTKEINLNPGSSVDVPFTLNDIVSPGIYTVTASVSDESAGALNIGYDPRGIVSKPDAQPDFDQFWQDALSELAEVDPNYKMTLQTNLSTNRRNVWLVEMNSLTNDGKTPVVIRAYYAEPTAEGTYPCAVHFQGYDSEPTTKPWAMGGNDHPGWCDLIVSMRGQMVNNRDPYRQENAFYGDWFAYNFGDRDTYYYRGAYADAVRALDFVTSREKVDKTKVFAQGTSQGGAFTIIAAALTDKFTAIAPSVQFMGDFPDYFKRASWPASVALAEQSKLGISDEDMYKFLSYFDTKNFASRISCPVITNVSLQDNICPPHTNMAPINNLSTPDSDIEIVYNPTLQHAVAGNWWNTFFDFFDKHMDDRAAIDEIAVTPAKDDCTYYNVMGMPVTPGYHGIVIHNGKKEIWK